MEHLRVAGLIAGAVVEEVLHLRLRLSLGFKRASSVEALGARDRGHDGGEVGELLGLDGDELIARLRRLERAGSALAGQLGGLRTGLWNASGSQASTQQERELAIAWN